MLKSKIIGLIITVACSAFLTWLLVAAIKMMIVIEKAKYQNIGKIALVADHGEGCIIDKKPDDKYMIIIFGQQKPVIAREERMMIYKDDCEDLIDGR